MIIAEIDNNVGLPESRLIFGRKGNKVVKKYRCSFGRKKGRIVTNPSVCSAPLDIKKRFTLKNVWVLELLEKHCVQNVLIQHQDV